MPDTRISPWRMPRVLVRAGVLDPLRPGLLVRLKRDSDRWGRCPPPSRRPWPPTPTGSP